MDEDWGSILRNLHLSFDDDQPSSYLVYQKIMITTITTRL